MPPYQYDHDIGVQELKDDWRMSEEDINTLVAWVDAGSPMGNLEDLPLPKEYPAVGEWRLGEELGPPGHIIQSTARDVPTAGQDLWWEPEVPTGITTSRSIKAAANPRNPDPDQWIGAGQRTTDEISHAWIAATHLDDEGYERMLAEQTEGEQRTLAGSEGGQ